MNLKDKIFSIASKKEFEKIALQVFRYQYNNNKVYQKYCNQLNRDISQIKKSSDIPFLPISMFKKHQIISGSAQFETIFESSGTTGIETSKHYIKDLDFYEESFLKTFQLFYGNPENYT
ncbi:hypothetical protein, partial [Microcystis aeruginosa]|uniref:LuxE/PaaK family acyltransferase n=1 Tax=Microcystis aeruginosa TaxID=1126 RepID=UPI001B8BC6CD